MSTKRDALTRASTQDTRLVMAVASLLLRYPDADLYENLASLEEACSMLPLQCRSPFVALSTYLRHTLPLEAQASYVSTFDMKRRCCLYLSYYLNGDTRRRGMALWKFQEVYRSAGHVVLNGELPDFLPVVLEFGAWGYEESALRVIDEHRCGLVVLLEALEEMASPYAGVIRGIESLLAPRADHVVSEVERLAYEGPPSEMVGLDGDVLEPYGALSDQGCSQQRDTSTLVGIDRLVRR